MPNKRFIDRIDKKKIITECKDFYVRQENIPPSWLIYLFAMIALSVITVINYISVDLMMLPDEDPIPLGEIGSLLAIIATLVAVVAFISIRLIHKISDAVLTTQFLNLLFINSASANNEFIMLVNKEKIVVYADLKFDELFEVKSNKDDQFEKLITNKGFKDADKKKLLNAIENIAFEEVKCGELTIKVEPLNRPKGFVIISGIK